MRKVILLLLIPYCAYAQEFIYPASPEQFKDTYINAHKNKDEYTIDMLFYPIDKLDIHPDIKEYLKVSIALSKKSSFFFEKLDDARVEMTEAQPDSEIVNSEWKYAFKPEYFINVYHQKDGSYSVYAFSKKDGHYYGDPLIPSLETARAYVKEHTSKGSEDWKSQIWKLLKKIIFR